MKRPAGVTIAKKPAAATTLLPDASSIDMSDIFAKLRARRSQAGMTWKKFSSVAYHNATTLAMQSGFCEDNAKAIGRSAMGGAKVLYNEAAK